MIHAQELTKRYADGTLALDQLTLNIKPGEFVAVIGPSGAGKSTFLKLLNGTLPMTSGFLNVLGKNVASLRFSELRKLRRQIGFIFQQFNLVKNLSVMDNVLTGRLGYRTPLSGFFGFFDVNDRDLALRSLKDVGLDERIKSRVDQLSGGQQQRVAIARALVQEPKLILADEPMASLDPKLSETILQLLKAANEKSGITVIVNLHVLELAKRYAHRVIGLREGRVVFDGPTSGLDDLVLREIYGR